MAARRTEFAIALVVAASAAAVFALTWTFPPTPPALMQGMDPAAYPRLICLVILALAALLVFNPAPPGDAQPALGPTFWLTILACPVFVLVTHVAGMLAAGLLFLIGVGWLWGERRPLMLLAVSAGTMVAIWLVFVRGFAIPLPRGLLFED